jgi:4a-hydroxytetrahydrobiopterin dehydratase
MERLSSPEIDPRVAALAGGWHREGETIVCDIGCTDFVSAVALVDQIAVVAEEQGHHPDLLIHAYNQLRVTISTHSAGGLTELDFQLAARIERLR